MKNFIFTKLKFQVLVIIIVSIVLSCSDEYTTKEDEVFSIEENTGIISDNWFLVKTDGGYHRLVQDYDETNYVYSEDILISKSEVTLVGEFSNSNFAVAIQKQKELNKAFEETTAERSGYLNSCIALDAQIWPNKIVYFKFDNSLYNDEVMLNNVFKGLEEWAHKTRLRMKVVPMDWVDDHAITIKKQENRGCSCTLGYGEGSMNLGPSCDVQSVIHEMGHAVGFVHEHQRPKRNDYLTVASERDFKRLSQESGISKSKLKNNVNIVAVHNDDAAYDYESVMHYGSWSRNNVQLMEAMHDLNIPFFRHKLTGALIERPTKGLTEIDIQKVNEAYFN